jgi:hypothetical protein
LIDDRDLYFAADTVVLRLDSRTGAVRWRRELHLQHGFSLKERALGMQWTPQFLGRLLIRDAGENIAVSSLGWASGAKFNWLADPPTFALLSKADGNVLGRVGVPGVKFLYDAQSTEFGHFLIANDRVLALDDQPSVRATYRAPMDLQPLGGFVELGSQVIVTTASGLAALSADSLKVQWVHRCGRLLAQEGALDWAGAHYIVTTQGLLRLDPGSGARPAAYYPLRGTWARFTSNGVILGAGQTLRLVVLPSPSERMHQD